MPYVNTRTKKQITNFRIFVSNKYYERKKEIYNWGRTGFIFNCLINELITIKINKSVSAIIFAT